MLSRACNFSLALLQVEKTCWSKLGSEPMNIPSKVSLVVVVNEASLTDRSAGVLELKSKLHFLGLYLRDYTETNEKFGKDKF